MLCGLSSAQNTKYLKPVDFSIRLAGNIGELRGGHFHSGLDIKALKGMGSPIMATADGYVSRIGISPTGYGNVLYVTHPTGETSVYGHLDRFNAKIARWVKAQQYAKKSFSVNLYPPKELFTVEAGEVIAYLGNSGSSGGPHLHFEIRDKDNRPLNLANMQIFDIPDYTAPELFSVTLYEMELQQGVRTFTPVDTVVVEQGGKLELETSRPFYLAYEVIDYKYGSPNTMGIYSLTQSVEGEVNYSFTLPYVDFGFSKYVQTFGEYFQNKGTRYHVIRAYRSENNQIPFYKNVRNSGLIDAPTDSLTVRTELSDDNGNKSEFTVVVRAAKVPFEIEQRRGVALSWDTDFSGGDDALLVSIEKGSLYDDAVLNFSTTGTEQYIIGDSRIPLHRSINVSVATTQNSPRLYSRALFYNTATKSVAKAQYSKGWYSAKLSTFGQYTIKYDTVAPKITPQPIKDGKVYFKVTDNLSGVKSYSLRDNGSWVVLGYDPKKSMMYYEYEKGTEQTQHELSITVEDYCLNSVTETITIKGDF